MLRPRHILAPAFLLLPVLLFATATHAQTPAEHYAAAAKLLAALVPEYQHVHDGSPAAVAALENLNRATADAVVGFLTGHPQATPVQIIAALCAPGKAAADCGEAFALTEKDISSLAPGLFLLSTSSNFGGNIFVIGFRNGKPAVLWSLADAPSSPKADPHGLAASWRADHASQDCWDKWGKPGIGELTCGPMLGNADTLPPDVLGRPRFYVSAWFEQSQGGTVAKQTSIWRWDGDRAELQWIALSDVYIDQIQGTSFDHNAGVLLLGEKGEPENFWDCGGCLARPLEHRIGILKDGVQDFGIRSLVPELDFVDSYITRLRKHQQTASIASPRATAAVLRWLRANGNVGRGKSVGPDFGEIEASTARLTPRGATICVTGDELGSAMHFALRRTVNDGYFIQSVHPGSEAECAPPWVGPPSPMTSQTPELSAPVKPRQP